METFRQWFDTDVTINKRALDYGTDPSRNLCMLHLAMKARRYAKWQEGAGYLLAHGFTPADVLKIFPRQ